MLPAAEKHYGRAAEAHFHDAVADGFFRSGRAETDCRSHVSKHPLHARPPDQVISPQIKYNLQKAPQTKERYELTD